MRRPILFAVLAAVSGGTAIGSISPAAAAQEQYCLQGRQWGYPGNCQFSSYPHNAWPPRAVLTPIARSIPITRSLASCVARIRTDTESTFDMAAVVACPDAERRSIPIGGTANLKPGDLNSRSALAILNERLRDECPYSRWKGRRGVYPGDTTMKSRTRNAWPLGS